MTVRPLTEQEVRAWLDQFPHSYIVVPLCEDWLRLNEALKLAEAKFHNQERADDD